jgi:integrase
VRIKLTQKVVDSAEVTGRQYILWDEALMGFGLRVTPAGVKSYVIQYRGEDGSTPRKVVARADRAGVNLHQARELARKLLAQARLGEDPFKKKREEAKAAVTVKDLAARYLSEYAEVRKKPHSVYLDRRTLDNHILPELGKRRVGDLTRQDVNRLHQKLAGTPVAANRTLALLRKMMNLAELWGLRPDGSNPCRHIQAFKERPRRRYLSPEELARLGKALREAQEAGEISDSAARLFRLLLLTGARKGELLGLRWEEVDLRAGVLNLADSKTGQKTIPLAEAAVELLKSTPRLTDNPYVFPGQRAGAHLVNPQKPWNIVRDRAGLKDVHLHDLRHTFGAAAASRGYSLEIIGGALGHTQAATTKRYAHVQQTPVKQMADEVAGALAGALDAEEAA